MYKELSLEEIKKLEGCIYDVDHNDYSVSLNKDSLQKVLNGEEIKRTLYLSGHSIEDIQEWMRKELIIGLLSDNERKKQMTEAYVTGNHKDSMTVRMDISNQLLENLLAFEGSTFSDSYDYRYNMRGDKILFYVLDKGRNRMWLNNNIDLNNQLFEQKFSK